MLGEQATLESILNPRPHQVFLPILLSMPKEIFSAIVSWKMLSIRREDGREKSSHFKRVDKRVRMEGRLRLVFINSTISDRLCVGKQSVVKFTSECLE